MENELDREQWILVKQLSAAIMCLNAPFCDNGPAEKQGWVSKISIELAKSCSLFALDGAIDVIEGALQESIRIRDIEKSKLIGENNV